MASFHIFDACSAILLLVLSYVLYLSATRKRAIPYPPGPKGYPCLGNIFDPLSSGEYQWLAYKELADKHNSDIIHLNMAGTHIVVVSSASAANDLFDKRSTIYSSRPRWVMMNELSGLSWNFGFREYDPMWKDHRALFHKIFQPPALYDYYPVMLNASRLLLQKFLQNPSEFVMHLRHMAGMIILSSAYGMEIKWENDPWVALGERSQFAIAMAGRPGVYLVDSIPWLKYAPSWLPGTGFQREARKFREDIEIMPEMTMDFVKKSLAEGIARPSIASRYLQEMEERMNWSQKEEQKIKGVLGVMYSAGADSTVSTLGSFIMAMVLHPQVQRKAQTLVDAVVGHNRLPSFSDRGSIPYIDAIMMETLRCWPVTPLGLPHASTSEDVYRGYCIPKGTIVIGNSWAIMRDPTTYGPDAHVFNPDRFMKGDQLNHDVPVPDPAFGYGRRSCAGREAAEASMWITIASLLVTFNFSRKDDTSGDFGSHSSGLLSYPPKFECNIEPRSVQAIALIQEGVQDVS